MKSVLVLLALAILILPAGALYSDETIIYVYEMGVYRQAAMYRAEEVETLYQSGSINATEYDLRMRMYNVVAGMNNEFLDKYFNNTIYRKWSLPIYPMS